MIFVRFVGNFDVFLCVCVYIFYGFPLGFFDNFFQFYRKKFQLAKVLDADRVTVLCKTKEIKNETNKNTL